MLSIVSLKDMISREAFPSFLKDSASLALSKLFDKFFVEIGSRLPL
jgi:hypothetical protein